MQVEEPIAEEAAADYTHEEPLPQAKAQPAPVEVAPEPPTFEETPLNVSRPLFCCYCGTALTSGAVFCPSCGKRLVKPKQSKLHITKKHLVTALCIAAIVFFATATIVTIINQVNGTNAEQAAAAAAQRQAETIEKRVYIIDNGTTIYHTTRCTLMVKAPEDKIYYFDTSAEAEKSGYSLCKICGKNKRE